MVEVVIQPHQMNLQFQWNYSHLGFFIYFGYGICHSHVNKSNQQEEPPVADQ